MALKICQFICILLSALTTGAFWGPWLGLTRGGVQFQPNVFLAVGHRMIRNFRSVMPILMPATVLSVLPVLLMVYRQRSIELYLDVAGLTMLVAALLVTLIVEVPIDRQIASWTATTLPGNWRQLWRRWETFHTIRTAASVAGLAFLISAAIF
jgi:uncharacterized membrane protein